MPIGLFCRTKSLTTMNQKSDYDVAILGAGISGLSAAYNLKKLGKSVIVLEAKDRIGGRLIAAELKCKTGTDIWDLGGQCVGSTQHHVMELIKELGMEIYKQYTGGKSLESEKEKALEFKVKGSAWKICDTLADKIARENVICGDPVNKIVQTEDSCVTVSTKAGRSYRAEHVIAAIPPHLVNEIEFDPPLPVEKTKMRQQTPVKNAIKFVITYQTAFWREKTLSQEASFTNAPFSVGPISDVIDGSTEENPALVGSISPEQCFLWCEKSMEERMAVVLESLSKVLGKRCLDHIEYRDKDWTVEPYNGGCRGYVTGPVGLHGNYSLLTEPHDRTHWAGTELGTVLYAFMDGAVESSKRAVDEIMGATKKA